MEFELLADSIKQINDKASSAAKSAVNQLMTLQLNMNKMAVTEQNMVLIF